MSITSREFYLSRKLGGKNGSGKLHLEYTCTWLGRVRVQAPKTNEEQSAQNATAKIKAMRQLHLTSADLLPSAKMDVVELTRVQLLYDARRPCRTCALEWVIDWMDQSEERIIPVSFSGQEAPLDKGASGVTNYEWERITDSAAERLVRIAERLEMPTVMTPSGPVAYGKVGKDLLHLLRRNFRTYQALNEMGEALEGDDASAAVAAYWMLSNQMPTELDGDVAELTSVAVRLILE